MFSLNFLWLKPISAAPPQAFLKINQFYILYTNPIVPYRVQGTDFVVGLQSLALMLNAKAFENTQAKTITLVKEIHKITFTVGSRTALIDGKPTTMTLPAELNQPSLQMLVPMSALIKAFRIHSQWNTKRRLLTLTGKDLMNNINSDALGNVGLERPSSDTTTLVPLSADLGGPQNQQRHLLNFTVQNASHQELPKGYAYSNSVTAGELPLNINQTNGRHQVNYVISGVPWPPDLVTPSPALKPGGTWLSYIGISGPTSPKTIYVAVWLVARKMSHNH